MIFAVILFAIVLIAAFVIALILFKKWCEKKGKNRAVVDEPVTKRGIK
jgi:hypothetical protein